jgi:hypothetical protein
MLQNPRFRSKVQALRPSLRIRHQHPVGFYRQRATGAIRIQVIVTTMGRFCDQSSYRSNPSAIIASNPESRGDRALKHLIAVRAWRLKAIRAIVGYQGGSFWWFI